MRLTPFKAFLVFGIAALLCYHSVYAKKMYRVYDENGNVYFSDQLPPDQVQYKRETLSEKARVLNSVEKAKTAEQLKLQKRLEQLRKDQEKIVAKQASNDKVLLSTFRSLDDMNKGMERKLAAFDFEKIAIEGNISRYEQQLKQQQLQAAELERNDQKIPDTLLAAIAASKQHISAAKQELDHHMAERQKIEKEFKADIARFQFLTQATAEAKNSAKSLAESNAINALGLFICVDDSQCEKAWKFAGEYVAKHSTTGADVETDQLIMHAAPASDDDLSLSVSRMTANNGILQIFLDVRCKQSSIGEELCLSHKVQTLREEFAPYLQSQLTSQ